MVRLVRIALLVILSVPPLAQAADLSADDVNAAQLAKDAPVTGLPSALIAKAQILLDRARFSPGEIDGKAGENFKKALRAFALSRGLTLTDKLTQEVWSALAATSEAPAITEYSVTRDDVKGPFLSSLPSRLEEMQDLEHLNYTGPDERLAERFHVSRDLLLSLNSGKPLDVPDQTIFVANVRPEEERASKVARIEVVINKQILRAFDKANTLVAVYPATVGSKEKPSPRGLLKITGTQRNPTYRYNPEYAFKGVRATHPFTIKPGPNNPVGVVWIGLSEKGYGIHGTPDPGKVSKAESHGCVRLTNWDALDLANRVQKGTPVMFMDDPDDIAPQDRSQRRKKARRH